jgi:hypothetical protein
MIQLTFLEWIKLNCFDDCKEARDQYHLYVLRFCKKADSENKND